VAATGKPRADRPRHLGGPRSDRIDAGASSASPPGAGFADHLAADYEFGHLFADPVN
jgi:hypothetical protein